MSLSLSHLKNNTQIGITGNFLDKPVFR